MLLVGPLGLEVGPQEIISGMQEVVGDVGALLVGMVEELEWSVGVLLDEDCCVDVSPLEECDDVLGEEDERLLLCVEEWCEVGALEEDVPSEPLLVPVGMVGAAVAAGALDEDVSEGVPAVPSGVFPDPPSTTAAAPATSSTAVVTAPTSVFFRGPPGPPGVPGPSKSSSSRSTSAASSASSAASAGGTSSSIRVASDSMVLSRSGLSTCV